MRLEHLAAIFSHAMDGFISAGARELLRRFQSGESGHKPPPARRNRFAISHGREPVTADMVARVEAEDDVA